MGRIALVYQTLDGRENGAWNQAAGNWEEVDDSHGSAIKDGLRIARKQTAPDLISLPILAATQGGAK